MYKFYQKEERKNWFIYEWGQSIARTRADTANDSVMYPFMTRFMISAPAFSKKLSSVHSPSTLGPISRIPSSSTSSPFAFLTIAMKWCFTSDWVSHSLLWPSLANDWWACCTLVKVSKNLAFSRGVMSAVAFSSSSSADPSAKPILVRLLSTAWMHAMSPHALSRTLVYFW